jgi:hypothetical protein
MEADHVLYARTKNREYTLVVRAIKDLNPESCEDCGEL